MSDPPVKLVLAAATVAQPLGAVGAVVLVEVIFQYPGVGSLLYQSIRASDYYMIQGVVFMIIVAIGRSGNLRPPGVPGGVAALAGIYIDKFAGELAAQGLTLEKLSTTLQTEIGIVRVLANGFIITSLLLASLVAQRARLAQYGAVAAELGDLNAATRVEGAILANLQAVG
ncbi:ABC transporter permease subunit, partial [Lacticaseibacillus rhamnosus]